MAPNIKNKKCRPPARVLRTMALTENVSLNERKKGEDKPKMAEALFAKVRNEVRLDSTPPIRTDLLFLDDLGRDSGRRIPELEVFDSDNTLDWLPPLVASEVEETPVNWHEQAVIAECAEAANGAFRAHVDIGPERIRGANLKHREVEGTISLAYIAETVPFPRVGAVKDAVLRAN